MGRVIDTFPATGAQVVTPSDTNDIYGNTLAPGIDPCRSLYIGTTGNLVVVMLDDNDDTPVTKTFNNVPVGVFPIQVVQVRSTNTTATDIVALL